MSSGCHLVTKVVTHSLPDLDIVEGPPSGTPEWPYCTEHCVRYRNESACPLLTQFSCHSCGRVLAYLIHGLKSSVKRRYYGSPRITHMWPNFQDEEHIYCNLCARARYPKTESILGKTFEQLWTECRNYDHISETLGFDK